MNSERDPGARGTPGLDGTGASGLRSVAPGKRTRTQRAPVRTTAGGAPIQRAIRPGSDIRDSWVRASAGGGDGSSALGCYLGAALGTDLSGAALAGEAAGLVQRKPDGEGAGSRGGPMWRHLIGEASTPVGELARVKVPRGLRLRTEPHAGAETVAIMPFDTLVRVERKTEHGWAYVIALGDANDGDAVTGQGFCEFDFLMLGPPEPAAHLHHVQGELPKDIAARYYKGGGFDWGADARLFVEAIWQANEDRTRGVYRQEESLSLWDTAFRGAAAEQTLRVWRSIGVRDGHAIWIPSRAFVSQLEAQGAISSGSISHEAWEAAKGAVDELIDWAKYGAGFVVGLLEGAYGAVRDLVMGVVDLVEMIYDIVKAVIQEGFVDACRSFGEKIVGLFENAPDTLQSLGAWFAGKWMAKDAWDRGTFQGEVIGYVAMTIVLTLLTLGVGTAAQAGGKFAQVIKVIRALDAAGDITSYAGKLKRVVRIPDGVNNAVRGKGQGLDLRRPDTPGTSSADTIAADAPADARATRYDNFPNTSQGKTVGRMKSHIDAQGNLRPADPNGPTTPVQHVRGSEPMKSKSPYTSFSEGASTGKTYGAHKIEVDLDRLRRDIQNGAIEGVEIVEHDQLTRHLQVAVDGAQARYAANASPKNLERLERAKADLHNASRDREILIKGIIPAHYIDSQPPVQRARQR